MAENSSLKYQLNLLKSKTDKQKETILELRKSVTHFKRKNLTSINNMKKIRTLEDIEIDVRFLDFGIF